MIPVRRLSWRIGHSFGELRRSAGAAAGRHRRLDRWDACRVRQNINLPPPRHFSFYSLRQVVNRFHDTPAGGRLNQPPAPLAEVDNQLRERMPPEQSQPARRQLTPVAAQRQQRGNQPMAAKDGLRSWKRGSSANYGRPR